MYRPSRNDIRFCLDHVVEIGSLYTTDAFPDLDASVTDAVLDAAASLARDVLAPLNTVGDRQGAKLHQGQVVIADGFKAAIKAFGQGGWNGVAAHAEHGGQGLPKVLEQACFEMFHSANMAFTLNPLLGQGAIEALTIHGTARQKALYLPHLISGDWCGTMNLTEPQSGSDLSTLKTSARPAEDGTYYLTGNKIFITWGDHDAVDNILHLVLARLPDAPEGTRGISLFLCPKYLVNEDGTLGSRNGVKAVGVEHKMGIHASPTCVMAYEGAVAEMVGLPNQGLMTMFVMMNAARMAVGCQGVGIADRAWQQAQAYALDRRQGKSLMTGINPASIYDHPDVRLMLGLGKARIEAARAMCFMTARAYDDARHGDARHGDARHGDASRSARAKRREDFLVPIAKSWATQVGCDVSSMGIQVHGGMGYIEETGAAQHFRDSRIAPIYEGTNGIQAADLIGRKLAQDDGLAAKELSQDIRSFIKSLESEGIFKSTRQKLMDATSAFDEATAWIIEQKSADPAAAATGASRYLTLCGDLIGGWLLAKAALAAHTLMHQDNSDTAYLTTKLALNDLYTAQILAQAPAHLAAITMTATPLQALTFAAVYPD